MVNFHITTLQNVSSFGAEHRSHAADEHAKYNNVLSFALLFFLLLLAELPCDVAVIATTLSHALICPLT